MPVVPIRKDNPDPAVQSQPAIPPDVYLMMAAAQMHSEGRLVKKKDSNAPAGTSQSPPADRS